MTAVKVADDIFYLARAAILRGKQPSWYDIFQAGPWLGPGDARIIGSFVCAFFVRSPRPKQFFAQLFARPVTRNPNVSPSASPVPPVTLPKQTRVLGNTAGLLEYLEPPARSR